MVVEIVASCDRVIVIIDRSFLRLGMHVLSASLSAISTSVVLSPLTRAEEDLHLRASITHSHLFNIALDLLALHVLCRHVGTWACVCEHLHAICHTVKNSYSHLHVKFRYLYSC